MSHFHFRILFMSKHLQPNLKTMLPMLLCRRLCGKRRCGTCHGHVPKMDWNCRYEKLKSYGLGMNLVAYSTLIDARAHTPSAYTSLKQRTVSNWVEIKRRILFVCFVRFVFEWFSCFSESSLLPQFQARAGNFERAHGLLERMEKDPLAWADIDGFRRVSKCSDMCFWWLYYILYL